ncbi:Glutathione S-transferase-like protein OpS6 [Penicillium canariense]|uniref:Glutathione S-transferase-like protein OpS6 n=1 Tax=Penicillium canariense TaxID=189055 RepID=A0A9W9LUU0_9EURO|nr:Glutathione S-transferase-like protein OpS6 [Penicillium canariense]KAJ5176554.1 Glutathione S-transferase-like protein OpS6 [Penicillium canariense]
MSLQPIKLYGHGPGPNPWKVIMVFEELNIPYIHTIVDFADMKKEPFESINPNGRVPAIEDPNTGITLWESGAIVEYLVETYDKQHTISFNAGSKDYFLAKQWLHFQVSGQGPYFGQAVWFTRYHSEKVESAKERYVKEIRRVSSVLDRFLADKEYLVGGQFSYADLAFIPWFLITPMFDIELATEFPNVDAWLNRQKARPAIAKALHARDEAMAAH